MELSPLATAVTVTTVLLFGVHLYRLNRAMTTIPQQALDYSPHRWTEKEICETYERVCKEPIDFRKFLPPKLERRYIVVGGSGLVGGDIVLHLLLRGQPPSAIRIADFSAPTRPDLLQGPAAQVDFVKTDVTQPCSLHAAFAKAWAPSVANLPLTVFHTAAVIRPAERSLLVWERTAAVNVTGTRHSLLAAREAGADVFVFTSSVSAGTRKVSFAIPTWGRRKRTTTTTAAAAAAAAGYNYHLPRHCFQVVDESDFDAPLRPHGDFFANYAYSKALSERMVGEANGPGFRTGCIRPGNGIYGLPKDLVFADFLRRRRIVSFGPQVIQNTVSGWNVSLAHLCFEAALVAPARREGGDNENDEEEEQQQQQEDDTPMPACAGRPYIVTDAGPPPQWEDFFRAARLLSVTPLEVTVVPPLPLFLVAHVVEWWSMLLARFPSFTRAPFWFAEPRGDLQHLQPAVFTPCAYVMCDDSRARRRVEDGGIGYVGGTETLEAVCELIRDWNREQERLERREDGRGERGGKNTTGKSILKAKLAVKAVAA